MNTTIADSNDRRRAAWELAAVLATGGFFLVFENVLHLKLPFLAVAIVAWTTYIVRRLRAHPRAAWEWGLWRRESMGEAVGICAAVVAVAALLLVDYRFTSGWIPLPASVLVLLLLYPAWGFIQQFVLQSLATTNLEFLGLPSWSIVPVSATLFAIAHLPDVKLAAICWVAGTVFTAIFRRTHNLVPLAIAHAWLGTLVYYWILERDPWLEMVPKVLDAVPKAG